MTDPRFDPRFQRGYDGQEPVGAEPTPSTTWRRPEVTSVAASGPASPPPLGREAAPAATRDATPAPDAIPAPDASAVVDAEPWRPSRRNPFALALLIAGLVMVASGIWVMQLAARAIVDGSTPGQQFLDTLTQQLGPVLLLCGIVGIVAWLALGALAAPQRAGRD